MTAQEQGAALVAPLSQRSLKLALFAFLAALLSILVYLASGFFLPHPVRLIGMVPATLTLFVAVPLANLWGLVLGIWSTVRERPLSHGFRAIAMNIVVLVFNVMLSAMSVYPLLAVIELLEHHGLLR